MSLCLSYCLVWRINVFINGDKRYYIIGESFITLTVISVLQYRLVITLSVITLFITLSGVITLSVIITLPVVTAVACLSSQVKYNFYEPLYCALYF